MKKFLLLTALLAALAPAWTQPALPHRVFVLTDIENEPDDAQSLVRFLLYCNQWEVEGLVATTSTHLRNRVADDRIRQIVSAYGKVRDNLLLHEPGYPPEAALQAVVRRGIPEYGMAGVGEGKDSEGSEALIAAVDRDDARPVWVPIWGGANVLAQALWKVRRTRTEADLARFVAKLRVYTISDQDDSAPWIRKEFPGLFYIVSPGENYRHATWAGISGEPWYQFASGADTSLVRNPWLKRHIIEGHGPLGEAYPLVEYAMEGDTPSFLHLIENGLNAPERPDWGGWGGRYEWYQPKFLPYRNFAHAQPETRPIWTDAMDEVRGPDGRIYIDNRATIWRWREAYQHDFAARMDWCIKPYREANHPPVARVNLTALSLYPGDTLRLSAAGSTDPDEQPLRYQWFIYPEAGSFWHWSMPEWEQKGAHSRDFQVLIPKLALPSPRTLHVILAVSDTGSPSLTRYQRVVVTLLPPESTP